MNEIQVVPRDAIPPTQSAEQEGGGHELGELRDFRWNAQLREFMPTSSEFSVRWVRLESGEVLAQQVHALRALMVFYAGSGTILGELEGPVVKDDVVVIPAGCKHGFVGGPDGLSALSIQLGEELRAEPGELRGAEDTTERLLAYNQERLDEFRTRPMFDLFGDGTLDEPLRRKAFLDALRIWLDGSQALGEMPRGNVPRRAGSATARDSTMAAISGWFAYQMFVLDDVEKAVIRLAMDSAIGAYHVAATPMLALHSRDGLFGQWPQHSAPRSDLLRNQSARTEARLRGILEEAWDMLSAMADRVVELTRQA